MKRIFFCAALVLFGLGVAIAGRADTTYTWNFATSTRNGDVGFASSIYLDNSGAVQLPVHGYTTTNDSTQRNGDGSWQIGGVFDSNLFGKFTSTITDPESGLGFTSSGSDTEIVPKSFIQLDLSGLKAAHLTNPTVTVSSIQQNEGYQLWGSNTAGVPGMQLSIYINSNGTTGADISNSPYAGEHFCFSTCSCWNALASAA